MHVLGLSDFYVLRRPAKAVDDIVVLNQLAAQHERIEGIQSVLKELFNSKEVSTAIYLSSPNLYRQLKSWSRGEDISPKKRKKLLLSLYKYYVRMSSRCTPYGMFAGCATGTIDGEHSEIEFLNHLHEPKYSARLDTRTVTRIVGFLKKSNLVKKNLKFQPNSSLYEISGSYRFIEYYLKEGVRSHVLSTVKKSAYIERALSFSKDQKYIDEIALELQGHGLSEEQATKLVDNLVRSQILVSEIDDIVTGEEYDDVLLSAISPIQGLENYGSALQEIKGTLQSESSINSYEKVRHILEDVFSIQASGNLVQVDTFYPTVRNNLNPKTVISLSENLECLLWLNHTRRAESLEDFRKKFFARYEKRCIPLTVALDSEVGIGYGISSGETSDYLPLLKGVQLPDDEDEDTIGWNKLSRLKQEKILEANRRKVLEVEITEDDIEKCASYVPPAEHIPESIYVIGSWLAKSFEEIDQGQAKFLLKRLAGPSAGTLLGRFCHGDSVLEERVRQSLQEEEKSDPEAVFAEIVHLPDAKMGNIIARPTLRAYEIPYLGTASVKQEYQLTADDLYLYVEYDQIVLFSKRLNKRVIPRLSSAHNYTMGLPLYKFLGDLQLQHNELNVSWDWAPFRKTTFLPRIKYKNIILSSARWYFRSEDFQEALNDSQLNTVAFFKTLREQWSIPKLVYTVEGDHQLLVDLDSPIATEVLRDHMLKADVVLYEFLSTPDQCPVKDHNGKSYANEVVIPLKKKVANKKVRDINFGSRINTLNTNMPKDFSLGSSWLYLKLYSGTKTSDKILTNILYPLTESLLESETISQWFFIRYADPEKHLRVRFYNAENANFWKDVLAALYPLLSEQMEQGAAYRIQTDTYKREVERYGTTTMPLTEQLFFNDSVAVTRFISLLIGNEGEQYRWLFAIRGVDMLLDDFGCTLEEKLMIIGQLRDRFFEEHKGDSKLKYDLDVKFRQERHKINSILDTSEDQKYPSAIRCFQDRSTSNRPIVREIYTCLNQEAGRLPSIQALMKSYIHMFLNRMFVSKQRLHELVVYHYMAKYYESSMAIEKNLLTKM
uniref:Lantibiotic dehydratase n=1 Tax=Roseihalotalea indica TaxID=2867963 RepID=A0AA49GGA1_9BACT|nr:lantibiotic dehydratase [Tunicatimonas sp. TK19036]